MKFSLNPDLFNAAAERAIVGGPDADRGIQHLVVFIPAETAAAIGIAPEIQLRITKGDHAVRFCLSEANDPTGRETLECVWQPVEPSAEAIGYRYAMRSPALAALDLVRIKLGQMMPLRLAS